MDTIVKVGGTLEEGRGAQGAANYTAEQLRRQAGQEQVSSQRVAGEDARQAQLNVSRALAVAAASGGSATDPTVLRIISGLEGTGKLNSLTALYEGSLRAQGLRAQADAVTYEGDSKRYAARVKAISTVLSDGQKAFGGINYSNFSGANIKTAMSSSSPLKTLEFMAKS